MDLTDQLIVGFDLGGSALKCAAFSVDSTLTMSQRVERSELDGPTELLRAIDGFLSALDSEPQAIGVGIPGELDREGMVVRFPNIPGFEGLELLREVQAAIPHAVIAVDNDANCAAVAEARFGHGRAYTSFLHVTLGTGVGGGLILGHELVRGRDGFGGEIGHVIVEHPSQRVCGCGATGCLETFLGQAGLKQTLQEISGRDADSEAIEGAARENDSRAQLAWETAGKQLGRGLSNIVNVLNLEAITFGGGTSAAFDLMSNGVKDELRKRCMGKAAAEIPLHVSELGAFGGALGAAVMAWERA